MNAQKKVTGQVKDDTGFPLPGVTIIVNSSAKGSITDIDGKYTITAKDTDILTFSYIGFKSQKKVVGATTTINIKLITESKMLEEVVINVGYGKQKVKEVTGAVVQVKSDIIDRAPVSDISESIQGRVAGVNVQAASGRPGEAANIQIRGVGSLLGKLEPLYVVDGVPYESNPNIAPDQVETMDILKDGAAAAIYGVRASNGVILITTKRGKKGNVSVDLSSYIGIQNITSGTPLMNTQQQLFADFTVESLLNAGNLPGYFITTPELLDYDTKFVKDVQNNNAIIKNYNLGISGGTNDLSLNFNTSYFNQDGVLINSGFDRLSSRLNAQFTKGKFKAFATIGLTDENREQEPWGLYEYSIGQNPWQLPLSDLNVSGDNVVNIPVDNTIYFGYLAKQLQNIDDRKVSSSNIALNLEYEFIKGLSYKINLSRNKYDYKRKFFIPTFLIYGLDGKLNATASTLQAQLQEDYSFSERNVIENMLNYNINFGNHKVTATAVSSYEEFESKQFSIGAIGFPTNETQEIGQGQESRTPSSFVNKYTLAGLLGRIQYNYDERYLFSASIRRDGSSKFLNNRYATFPSLSAGWNISEEDFFKNSFLKNSIRSLKLRASYAQLGNQDIPPFSAATQLETGVNYLFGPNEVLSSGLIQRRYSNPNLKWETSTSKNIGIDLAMFDNKLTFNADIYSNDKKDMLLPFQTPPSGGTTQPNAEGTYNPIYVNAGKMTNKGIEIALAYRNQLKNGFKYDISGTFTKNVNEVVDLNGIDRGFPNGRPTVTLSNAIDQTTFFAVGHEAGAFFLIKNEGVIKTDDELTEYQKINPNAQKGDLRYADADGNNKIDENDRVYSGSGQADFEAGLNIDLNYKNFDLSVQSYLSYGAELFNGARFYAYAQGRHLDQYSQWSPQNPTSDIPSYKNSSISESVRARSDYWLEDGTYLRIRNITLGYSLPKNLIEKYGIGKIRLYLTGFNPFTFTKYTGYDPEVGGNGISTRGVDSGNYPVARRFVLGAQVKF
ncbi:TonB-linked outer membrane protein, SusC/RagA family [Flavobacterium flevense]|uniref:SusC/RagA family TonB-linked outer membrane protein n=2 Tax=Flavobacterium flevense TaxID=983 RepID=A0A4Y4AW82_9FLAO|nr:SusC/RagA family TonB-linked outer membrane protein [Flavobacterium flevense]SHM14130.1 TonB-linked outer membrane protein, SusC/RagA family [Flavobacterium flevense]